MCSARPFRRTDIDNFLTVLPLLQELSKASIQPRHWNEVMEVDTAECLVDSLYPLSLKACLKITRPLPFIIFVLALYTCAKRHTARLLCTRTHYD